MLLTSVLLSNYMEMEIEFGKESARRQGPASFLLWRTHLSIVESVTSDLMLSFWLLRLAGPQAFKLCLTQNYTCLST